MSKKWFHRLAESRRPDYIDKLGMCWLIMGNRWFGIGLVLRHTTDTWLTNRAETSRVRLVLDGKLLYHVEVPHYGDHEPIKPTKPGRYVYKNEMGVFECREVDEGQFAYEPRGRRSGVELFDVQEADSSAGALVVDFPWMRAHERFTVTSHPVFMLILSWHSKVRV